MMAAVIAAGKGGSVRLWEKNGSLGRKLLATGNGRCNFTNRWLAVENYHGGDIGLVGGIIEKFGLESTLEFFKRLGLAFYSDEKGRYFPGSNEALSVLFSLEQEMKRLDIDVKTHSEIVEIARTHGGWEVRQRGLAHRSGAVIMACGGAAAPQFGSNGQSYQMATRLNHSLIHPRPGLVPLVLAGNWFHKLQGLRMDLGLVIKREGKIIFTLTDEGLFNQYGLSGPVALKTSRLQFDEITEARMNFLPSASKQQTGRMLKERREIIGSRKSEHFLAGMLPEKLGHMLVGASGLSPDSFCSQITDAQLAALTNNICDWEFKIKGLRPFKEAQVTVGGIDCRQVFPETLMSKKAPGLFFCGEMLDVDGDTGGYNLQWCWSSGCAAGGAAVEYLMKS